MHNIFLTIMVMAIALTYFAAQAQDYNSEAIIDFPSRTEVNEIRSKIKQKQPGDIIPREDAVQGTTIKDRQAIKPESETMTPEPETDSPDAKYVFTMPTPPLPKPKPSDWRIDLDSRIPDDEVATGPNKLPPALLPKKVEVAKPAPVPARNEPQKTIAQQQNPKDVQNPKYRVGDGVAVPTPEVELQTLSAQEQERALLAARGNNSNILTDTGEALGSALKNVGSAIQGLVEDKDEKPLEAAEKTQEKPKPSETKKADKPAPKRPAEEPKLAQATAAPSGANDIPRGLTEKDQIEEVSALRQAKGLNVDPNQSYLPFKMRSVKLDETHKAVIEETVLKVLRENPAKRLQIKAYATESEAQPNSARRISLSRALAVRQYIMEQGIQPQRLDIMALGTSRKGEPEDRVDLEISPK